MDLQLPGMDGVEALRRLRDATRDTASIPVVAVTAFAMKDDRERAAGRRLRRLPREADQRAALPRSGPRRSCDAREAADVSEARADDPRRRRPAAERPAARGRAVSPRATACVTGGSGEEALRPLAEEHRPDLVLLDILMPGMDGLRGVPPDPRGPGHGVPPGRDDHRERRPGEAARRSRRAPTTSSPSRSTRPSCWRGSARCVRIKRYHDTIERQAAELAAWNQRARGSGWQAQVEELERVGRLRRFLVAAARRAHRDLRRRVVPREPPARDRRRLLRPARLHRRSPRPPSPRRSWSVLREYHAALGDLIFRFEGTLERFAGDGLMVFFNDPLPCDGRARCARCGWRSRCASGSRDLAEGWARRGPRPGLRRSASPRATPRSGRSASRGGSTTPPSAASRTSPRGCAPRPSRGRSSSPSGCTPAAEDVVVSRGRSASSTLRGFSRPVRAFDIEGLDAARVTS